MDMRKLLLLFPAALLWAAPRTPQQLLVQPTNPLMFGQGSTQQLVVVLRYSDGTEEDVTGKAQFVSAKPAVAQVTNSGLVTAEANGGAEIRVSYATYRAATTALVQHGEQPSPASFSGDIMPVLTKIGCNGGSCHGALNGQKGFKLSLFGYDPAADYEMIVHKHEGRRLIWQSPKRACCCASRPSRFRTAGEAAGERLCPDYNALLNWVRGRSATVPANERRVSRYR